MTIADWILSRSEAFKLLMMKFRDHKQDTIEAFTKVRRKHSDYDKRLEEHAGKLKQIEDVLNLLHQKVNLDSKPRIVIKSAIVKKARKK